MNVERVTQIFHGHRRTFDVPAGTTRANASVPEVFSGLRGFPQSKIASVSLFVPVGLDAGARLNSRHVDFRKAAVCRKPGNAVVNRTVALIGDTLLAKTLDKSNHVVNMIRSTNELLRLLEVKRIHISKECLDIFLSVFADADFR